MAGKLAEQVGPQRTYHLVHIRVFDASEPEFYPIELSVPGRRDFPRGHLRLDRTALLALSADSEAYGQALGEALFAEGAIGQAYRETRAVFQSRGGDRLRVRLWLDPVELHDIRWERVYHPVAGAWHPLAATADTLLSRYIMTQEWERPTLLEACPLRLLAVIASPSDVHKWELDPISEAETETWHAIFDELPDVAVTYLQSATDNPPTLKCLRQALMEGYHVVHFVCHGRKTDRETALYLEGEDGAVTLVKPHTLLEIFRALAVHPRLCFLAACESGARGSADAFVPLGPALVAEGGVPAVVAMAEQVGMATARQFAGHFYTRLLAHGSGDLAMQEARQMVREQWDWSVPVLFSRLPDNQLLGIPEASKKRPAVPGAKPVRGVPENLFPSLRQTLLQCVEFLEPLQLRAVLSNTLLTPWQHSLPVANNPSAQVDLTINHLADQYRANGENALVLLLRVLATRYDSSVDIHGQLLNLAERLERLK